MDQHSPKRPTKKVDSSQNENQSAKRKHDDEKSSCSEDEEIKWIEEDSESEPDLDCEIWDDDCYTIIKQKRKNSILGFNLGRGLQPANVPESIIHPRKQLKISLNENIINDNFKTQFKNNWASDNDFKTESVEFINNPFKFCFVDNFLENVAALDKIRIEMNDIDWSRRNMDLYEFFQSHDLKHADNVFIKKAYEFLKTDVKDWISDLCGIELTKASATCSFYSDTDYLLVHDDLQEDRAIAFVLYMTDPNPNSTSELWTPEMGGSLELLNKDENGHPNISVKKIYPKNNRFIFFKVTNESYHQVSEVSNMDHCRLSINGWFHTREPNPYISPKLAPPLKGLFSLNYFKPIDTKIHLTNWISSDYLHKNTRKEIQKQIESESEISLNDFFKKDKFDELYEAIQNNDIIWESTGPSNRRKYETICIEYIPSIVTEFLKLFQSKDMFALLRDYTELDLVEKENMHPTMRMELQRWTPGCYSLLSEYDWENEKELDVIMHLGCSSQIIGGQTMYIAADEKIEDALISLETTDNTLNIVFRDTAKVTKHVSNRSQTKCFYILVCSYKE